jgi:Holliday junction DNA helicase RuvA
MIASLKGLIQAIGPDYLVVEVGAEMGGVGLKVTVPASLFDEVGAAVGRSVHLHTHLHVRENEWTLFGFASEESRAVFETLLGVNGVGPRTAVAIVGTLSPELLQRAVTHGEPDVLQRVPGIGRKTAERIVFHLKDKLAGPAMATPLAMISDVDAEVIAALTSLGYSIVEAQSALQSLPRDPALAVEERIRLALGYLAPR